MYFSFNIYVFIRPQKTANFHKFHGFSYSKSQFRPDKFKSCKKTLNGRRRRRTTYSKKKSQDPL